MAGLASLAGEDALCGVEAGDVIGLCEGTYENHLAALGRLADGLGGGQHDLALGRAW